MGVSSGNLLEQQGADAGDQGTGKAGAVDAVVAGVVVVGGHEDVHALSGNVGLDAAVKGGAGRAEAGDVAIQVHGADGDDAVTVGGRGHVAQVRGSCSLPALVTTSRPRPTAMSPATVVTAVSPSRSLNSYQ